MTPARILIVDDHALIGATLALALRDRGMEAEAILPEELLPRLDEPAPTAGLVMLDLDLGGDRDGASLVPALRRSGWRVLVLTGSTDEGRIATAVAAGAAGWLPKTSRFEEVVDAAVRATEGRSLLDDTERARLYAVAETHTRETEGEGSRWQRLTRREREIVEHIAAGKRPAEIAAECVVSVATVRTQIKSILSKLEVRSQLEAAAFARRHGAGGPRR